MKPMLTAFAAIVLIAIGANFLLGNAGFSSEDRLSGLSVRLDD